MEVCRKREVDKFDLINKFSVKNVELQLENFIFYNKVFIIEIQWLFFLYFVSYV